MINLTKENQNPQQLNQLEIKKPTESKEMDKRRMLVDIIFNVPGIRYKDLSRITRLNNGTLSYHLSTLEKNAVIQVCRSDNSNITRYYSTSIPLEETITLGYLKMSTTSKILKLLLDNECLTFSEIMSMIEKAPSTTSWNLKRLYEANVIVRRKRNDVIVFTLKNPMLLEKLMGKINNTLLDRSVDNYASLIDSL